MKGEKRKEEGMITEAWHQYQHTMQSSLVFFVQVMLVYENPITFWPFDAKELFPIDAYNAPLKLNDKQLAFLDAHHTDPESIQIIIGSVFCIAPMNDCRVLTYWLGGQAALLIENVSDIVLKYVCHDMICQYLNQENGSNRPINIVK